MRFKPCLGCSLLAIAALLGASAGAYQYLQIANTKGVEQKVLDVLADPDSARFSEVEYFKATGGGCGLVNAKNAMGGYVGFTPFVVTSGGEVSFEPENYERYADVTSRVRLLKEYIKWVETFKLTCPSTNAAH